MITEEELFKNGFSKYYEWNNRYYYNKDKFIIEEHFGIYLIDKDGCPYGECIESIEELNKCFEKWLHKRIKSTTKLIERKQKELERLKKYL